MYEEGDFIDFIEDQSVDEFGGDVWTSFAQKEARKMSDAIAEVEKKLYEPSVGMEKLQNEETGDECPKRLNLLGYRCSEGYAAHHDAVDEKEINIWKDRFPFLRVEGKEISNMQPSSSNTKEFEALGDSFDFTTRTLTAHIAEPWFSRIKEGRKELEGRLKRFDFEIISTGDLIEFYNTDGETCVVRVINITSYDTFTALLESGGLEKALPGVNTIEEGLQVYREFYGHQDEVKYGVIGLHIELVD